jgi:hypothetical protein
MDAIIRYRYVFPKTAAAERAAAILERLRAVPQPVVAEIGVYKGDLSCILLAARPDLQLLLVDPYESVVMSDEYRASDDFHTVMTVDEHRAARAMANLKTEFAWSRRELCMKPSVDAAQEYERQFDLVFIDGDHSYTGCKADIAAWKPLVKEGGWLSGHDYRTDKPGFGVKQAVDEAFPGAELDRNYTWFVRL